MDTKVIFGAIVGAVLTIGLNVLANLITPDRERLVDRVRNWWAGQSSKRARKRIQELEEELKTLSNYVENPQLLSVYFWRTIFRVLPLLGTALFLAIWLAPEATLLAQAGMMFSLYAAPILLPIIVLLAAMICWCEKPAALALRISSYDLYTQRIRQQIAKLQGKISGALEVFGIAGDMNWQYAGLAPKAVAMAAVNDKLFAIAQSKLWMCDPAASDISWQHIGPAHDMVAMAAVSGKLFAATKDNKLWIRDPIASDVPWQHIGHADKVITMTAISGKLFATTQGNKLWMRDPVTSDVSWQHIGPAHDMVAMVAIGGRLFAVTQDNKLEMCDPFASDIVWQHIGEAHDIAALTTIDGKLFVATKDDKLLKGDSSILMAQGSWAS